MGQRDRAQKRVNVEGVYNVFAKALSRGEALAR